MATANYDFTAQCSNCGLLLQGKLPRGVNVNDYYEGVECPSCGLRTISRDCYNERCMRIVWPELSPLSAKPPADNAIR